jgi:hypothetical protein
MVHSIKPKNIYLIVASLLALVFLNYWLGLFQTNFNYVGNKNPNDTANFDFHIYYSTGKAYLSGQNIYSSTSINGDSLYSSFIYPPTIVPFFAVFGLMDFEIARHIFLLFYLLVFILTLYFLLKLSRPEDRVPTLITGVGLALLSAPLLMMIRLGQIGLVVGCTSFASLLFYLNRQKNLSAFLLAIAVILKVNPIMLLATFVLFFNDWKYLLRFGIALGGILILSLLFIDPNWYWLYVTKVLPQLTASPSGYWLNQTPLRWLPNNEIPFFPNADKVLLMHIYSFIGMLFLTGFAWWAGKHNQAFTSAIRHGTNNRDALFIAYSFFLINISAALLLSAITWTHTYVWYILPLVPIILFAVQRTKVWFVVLIGLALFGVTSQVFNQDNILNYLNVAGACFCALSGFIVLVFPSSVITSSENTG